jgi:hypothetical protein
MAKRESAKAAAEKYAKRQAYYVESCEKARTRACCAMDFLAGVAWQRRQGRKKAKPRKQP